MKKFKLLLAGAAVILAVGGAAMSKAEIRMDDQQLYFVAANGTDDGLRTAASETMLRGCGSGNIDCAKGYNDPAHTQLAITLKKPN